MHARWSRGDTSSQDSKYWFNVKSVFFLIRNLLFHEGNTTEKCASLNVFILRKLVNLIYIWFCFLHFVHPLLWKMVRRTSCRGVQFLTSNSQVCKKKSASKEFNSNIWFFELAALALKNNHCVIHYVIRISWKIPLNELNELILLLKTSLSLNITKKYTPFELLKILVLNLRTHVGIYFRKVFYMTKKTCFFLSICLLLNISIVIILNYKSNC